MAAMSPPRVFRAAGRGEAPATILSLVVGGIITVAALLGGQSYIAILGVFLVAWNWRARAEMREEPQRRLLVRGWNQLSYDLRRDRDGDGHRGRSC